MSKALEEIIEEQFEVLVSKSPRFRWATMKDLYRSVKKQHGTRLRIKRFHNVIRKMWEERNVDLSRGSIVRPYVRRYGMHTDRGIYFYLKVRKKTKKRRRKR